MSTELNANPFFFFRRLNCTFSICGTCDNKTAHNSSNKARARTKRLHMHRLTAEIKQLNNLRAKNEYNYSKASRSTYGPTNRRVAINAAEGRGMVAPAATDNLLQHRRKLVLISHIGAIRLDAARLGQGPSAHVQEISADRKWTTVTESRKDRTS